MRLCEECGGRLPAHHRNPLNLCSGCKRTTGRVGQPGFSSGPSHPGWRGDAAGTKVKRRRAQRRYSLGPCQECGEPGIDRHHVDGDTGNNERDNIAILCRPCHMRIDGRADALRVAAERGRAKQRTEPRPCVNCAKVVKITRHGRCNACSLYFTKYGIERTCDRFLGPIAPVAW